MGVRTTAAPHARDATKLTEIAGGVVVVDARSGGGERRALWAGQWYTNQLQEGLRNIRA